MTKRQTILRAVLIGVAVAAIAVLADAVLTHAGAADNPAYAVDTLAPTL